MLTTEVSRTIAEHTFPVTDSYVSVVPQRGLFQGLGHPDHHVLVTALSGPEYSGGTDNLGELIGRIVPVRANRLSTAWYVSLDQYAGYVDGPVVNPEPVNGHYYRELSPDNEPDSSIPFVLRYNDDNHRGDREHESFPWTVVSSEVPHVTAPVQRFASPSFWVEVNNPDAEPAAVDEVNLAEIFDTEDTEAPQPGMIENTITSHTMGKAMVNSDGMAVLNPELREGVIYLVWLDSATTRTNVQEWRGDKGWVVLGQYVRPSGTTEVRYDDDPWLSPVEGDNKYWAVLDMTTPNTEGDDSDRVAQLSEQALALHESFEDLNDALNDMARSEGWCGEYERTMEAIGMRTRHSNGRTPFGGELPNTRRAFDVEVTAYFDVTIGSNAYGIESAIDRALGVSTYSLDDFTVGASLQFTIEGIVAEDENAARDMIDTEMVERELDDRLSITSDAVTDYDISNVEENEDFDWEEYDDNN